MGPECLESEAEPELWGVVWEPVDDSGVSAGGSGHGLEDLCHPANKNQCSVVTEAWRGRPGLQGTFGLYRLVGS